MGKTQVWSGRLKRAVGRRVRAIRGAFAFLTRIPVRHYDGDWDAFVSTPATVPVVGWVVGVGAAIPLLAAGLFPDPTVALAYLLAVYLLTGIHHLDGVSDLGDALAVPGDPSRRREVLKDTTTGVGALLALAAVVVGLALGGLALAGTPVAVAVGVVIAAEVGAKLTMATIACFGSPGHEGLGSQVMNAVSPRTYLLPLALSLPAAALTWPHPAAGAALAGATLAGTLPWLWARGALGGPTGDVIGAANEIGRVIGIHAGVIAWTLW